MGVSVKRGYLFLFLQVLVVIPISFASEMNLIADGNGNLVTGDGFYRTYDGLNQLYEIRIGNDISGPLLFRFTWDPLEERVLIRDQFYTNGSIKETVMYPWRDYIVIMNESGNFSETYVYAGNELVGFIDTDGHKRTVISDPVGTQTLVLDESGNVIDETLYSPFGEILAGGKNSRYDYEAKEFDDNTGEYDFGFRRYKPSWGIFMQPDTQMNRIYNPQELNHYSFELNNPYRYVDPSGHVVVGFEGLSADHPSGVQDIAEGIQEEDPTIPVGVFPYAQVVQAQRYIGEQLALNPNQPVVVYGHSFGGSAAVTLSNNLGKQGIAISNLYTIDPVGVSPLQRSQPGNVLSQTNFVQKNSIPKGNTIKGSNNVDLTSTKVDHVTIDNSKTVKTTIVTGAVAVHQNTKQPPKTTPTKSTLSKLKTKVVSFFKKLFS